MSMVIEKVAQLPEISEEMWHSPNADNVQFFKENMQQQTIYLM